MAEWMQSLWDVQKEIVPGTIVDVSDGDVRILREGPISEKQIMKVLHK